MAGKDQYHELNRLERRAAQLEGDASATRWAQADEIVRLLGGGATQREVAAGWINALTGKPHAPATVNLYAKAARLFANSETRPRFIDAQYQVDPSAAPAAVAERDLRQLPDSEQGLLDTIARAARKVSDKFDRAPTEIAGVVYDELGDRSPRPVVQIETRAETPAQADVRHVDVAISEIKQVSEAPGQRARNRLEVLQLELDIRLGARVR